MHSNPDLDELPQISIFVPSNLYVKTQGRGTFCLYSVFKFMHSIHVPRIRKAKLSFFSAEQLSGMDQHKKPENASQGELSNMKSIGKGKREFITNGLTFTRFLTNYHFKHDNYNNCYYLCCCYTKRQ